MLIALLAAVVPGASEAQTSMSGQPLREGQRAAASLEQIVQFVTATAYRGIQITDEQRRQARAIIIAATQDQQRLDTTRPDFIDRRQVIADRRRLALRALLTRPRDLEQYDRNALELEP